jgi:D-alanyl-D-alanine carboxypeptidase
MVVFALKRLVCSMSRSIAAFAVVAMMPLMFAEKAEAQPACPSGNIPIGSECVAVGVAADEIRDILRAAMTGDDLKAVVVSVKVGDTPVLTEAMGESMTGVPATIDMHFRNGAVAIAYLGTVLLQLQERGVLSLDDALAKWFPQYPKSDQITLRMLMNSTSGYADYVNLDVLPLYKDVFRQWTPAELIEIGLSQPMHCEPGKCFAYAHTNFVILGEVLTKATGKPVEDLIRDAVLAPLSLRNTRSESTAVIQEPVLHAYDGERGVYEESTYWNPSWTLARGAIMTTDIGDLLTSAIAIGSGSLLSQESSKMQLGPSTAGLAPWNNEVYYGLGVVVTNSWVIQTPSFAGYAAAMAYLPSRKIAIAVTATMGPKTPDKPRPTIFCSLRSGRISPRIRHRRCSGRLRRRNQPRVPKGLPPSTSAMMRDAQAASAVMVRTWFHMPQDDWKRFQTSRPSLVSGAARASSALRGRLRIMVTGKAPTRKNRVPASR